MSAIPHDEAGAYSVGGEAGGKASLTHQCDICSTIFQSRNALFNHLDALHYAGSLHASTRKEKVALLFSYLGGEPESCAAQGLNNVAGRACGSAILEKPSWEIELFKALNNFPRLPDSSADGDTLTRRPLAWSRSTLTEARASIFFSQPSRIPSVAELASLKLAPVAGDDGVDEWLAKINELLPPTLRILARCKVPPSMQAEKHCEMRCYQVLVPLSVLAPDLSSRQCDALEWRSMSDNVWRQRFRRLKKIMQILQGRHNFHNYSRGVLPHDAIAKAPKVIRFRHAVGDESLHADAPGFAVLQLHGNHFLSGMVQAMVSMAICVYRRWLPEDAIEHSLRPDLVMSDFPICPYSTTYFYRGRYDNFESKFGIVLPSADNSMTGAGASRQAIVRNIVEEETRSGAFLSWATAVEARAKETNENFLRDRDLAAMTASASCSAPLSPLQLSSTVLSSSSATFSAHVTALYARTLCLLQAADKSGLWPESSSTRARVIEGSSRPGVGGFALGNMPPPLEKPRANTLFFELMCAAFALEQAISNGERPPSSTIAVNRNAKFSPHTDSGSGAGQSTSLIVALGDFVGGELVVEGKVHNIRYEPLSFNGWTQRHWTLPFQGERFSLVWFTPRGCEGESGLTLCESIEATMKRGMHGSQQSQPPRCPPLPGCLE